jgi:hypothetical protein
MLSFAIALPQTLQALPVPRRTVEAPLAQPKRPSASRSRTLCRNSSSVGSGLTGGATANTVPSHLSGIAFAFRWPHRGPSDSAELAACECVVEAETKDHLNWELIEVAGRALKGDEAKALKDAYQQIEEQEDEHLYHTTGWCRELWIQSLGLPAVIPPPEEEKEVQTTIGAARAKTSSQGNAAGKTLRNGLAMASRPDTATR